MLPSLTALRHLSICPNIGDGYPDESIAERILAAECSSCFNEMRSRIGHNGFEWPTNGPLYVSTHCNHIHHRPCLYKNALLTPGPLKCHPCRADISYLRPILEEEYSLGQRFIIMANEGIIDGDYGIKYLLTNKRVNVDYVVPVNEYTTQARINNETALMTACKRGREEVVRALLFYRPDVNKIQMLENALTGEQVPMTALTLAIDNKQTNVVRMLLEVGDIDVNIPAPTPLMTVIKKWDREIFRMLLSKRANVDQIEMLENLSDNIVPTTALTWACGRFVNEEPMRALLAVDEINVNIPSPTPLLTLCREDQLHEDYASTFIKKLLRNGANVNIPDNHGTTPLMAVCARLRLECAEALLDVEGIQIDATNEFGQTALHIACQTNSEYYEMESGREEMVTLLLEKGANVNVRNNEQRTPLYIACFWWYTEVISILLKMPRIEINAQDRHGETALHAACRGNADTDQSEKDRFETVDLLLTHGADVNARDRLGDTPLHSVCQDTHSVKYWNERIATRLLDTARIEINAKNKNYKTPLVIASARGNVKAVQLLLERGADVNAAQTYHNGNYENNALVQAVKFDHPEVIEILARAGAKITKQVVFDILDEAQIRNEEIEDRWRFIRDAMKKRAGEQSSSRPRTRSRTKK